MKYLFLILLISCTQKSDKVDEKIYLNVEEINSIQILRVSNVTNGSVVSNPQYEGKFLSKSGVTQFCKAVNSAKKAGIYKWIPQNIFQIVTTKSDTFIINTNENKFKWKNDWAFSVPESGNFFTTLIEKAALQ